MTGGIDEGRVRVDFCVIDNGVCAFTLIFQGNESYRLPVMGDNNIKEAAGAGIDNTIFFVVSG